MWSHLSIEDFHWVNQFTSWGLKGFRVQFGDLILTDCVAYNDRQFGFKLA